MRRDHVARVRLVVAEARALPVLHEAEAVRAIDRVEAAQLRAGPHKAEARIARDVVHARATGALLSRDERTVGERERAVRVAAAAVVRLQVARAKLESAEIVRRAKTVEAIVVEAARFVRGEPETITVDRSGANLAGIEVMLMIRKGQMQDDGIAKTAVEQFYSLVI